MKQIFFAIVACVALSLSAQGSVYNIGRVCNMPRNGDLLHRAKVNVPMPQAYGDSVLWDFSSLGLKAESSDVRYVYRNDSILVRIEGHENASFIISGNGLDMISCRGQGKQLDYALPEHHIRYPMNYGDSISGYFYSEGTSGGTSFLRQEGFTLIAVIGQGCLITPDCDSLRHVLLTKYKRVGTTELGGDFDKSLSNSLDSALLSHDSIKLAMMNDSITHLHEIYSWWARGYRYPILQSERVVSFYDGQPADSVIVAYYISPHYQVNYLQEDTCNAYWREIESLEPFNMPGRANTINSHSHGVNQLNLGYMTGHDNDCELSPTFVEASTTLSYHIENKGDIAISIFDAAGLLLYNRTISDCHGFGSIDIDISDLPYGEYIVSVHIGTEPFSCKVFKK